MLSTVGKLSRRRTALKRCTNIEILWCRTLVSLASLLLLRVCVCIVTAPCTRWPTCVRRAGWVPSQAVGSSGRRTWPRASTSVPNVSRQRCVPLWVAAAKAPAYRTARRSGWRLASLAATEPGWWRPDRNSASAAVDISSTSSLSNCPRHCRHPALHDSAWLTTPCRSLQRAVCTESRIKSPENDKIVDKIADDVAGTSFWQFSECCLVVFST